MQKKRLGEVLRERGHISQQSLVDAIQEQAGKAVLLGELLLDRGLVSREGLVTALEEVTRVPYADLQLTVVDEAVLKFVPRSVAERYCVLPLHLQASRLVVVMAEPQNLYALDELKFVSGLDIAPRLGFRSEILRAIEKHYASPSQAADQEAEEPLPTEAKAPVSDIEFFTASSRQSQQAAIEEFQAELRKQPTPAVRLVSAIIASAAANKASDIHVDPQSTGTVVRIRVDGILRDLMDVPRRLQDSLISRIKILADMDIAERRAPQDGRLLVRIGEDRRDLRVSTLPTHYGEKVVIRLLDARATRVRFLDLGLSQEHSDLLASALALPQGLVLVTGPTGSGKTTTLYAALNLLSSRTLNIITVEDPLEYMLEGINQVQVNEKAGRTFSGCLRSILRQDPNVIMVGEIRDPETAEIALTAAQTGHLVLTTLHTKDSISAVTRLMDLNIPAFLIASSLTVGIAQRLVRKLCTCREEVSISPDHATRLTGAGISDFPKRVCIPVGCNACEGSGYKGRIGIYEMLVVDDHISSAIRAAVGPDEIRGLAGSMGMRFLQEEALQKVKDGITSLEEMLRVIPLKNFSSGLCSNCKRMVAPSYAYCPHCAWERRAAGPNSATPAFILPKQM